MLRRADAASCIGDSAEAWAHKTEICRLLEGFQDLRETGHPQGQLPHPRRRQCGRAPADVIVGASPGGASSGPKTARRACQAFGNIASALVSAAAAAL